MSAELITANLPYLTAAIGAGTMATYGTKLAKYMWDRHVVSRNAFIDGRIASHEKVKDLCDRITKCVVTKDYDSLKSDVTELNRMLRTSRRSRKK